MGASRQDFVRIAEAIERIDLSRYKDDEYQQRKYIAVAMAHALAPYGVVVADARIARKTALAQASAERAIAHLAADEVAQKAHEAAEAAYRVAEDAAWDAYWGARQEWQAAVREEGSS